jgi:hypothetical protein
MSNGDGAPRVSGCVDGVLADPRAYFFSLIGRTEGSPAPDWKAVLETLPGRGMGINPKPGEIQPRDAPHYGITLMIDAGGNARGRIWLPSDVANVQDGISWFTHEIQVIADGPTPGSFVWAWIDKGGAPYAPRPCQQAAAGTGSGADSGAGSGPGTSTGSGGGNMIVDLGPALRPLVQRIQELEKLVSAQAKEIKELKARPVAAPGGGTVSMPKRVALKSDHGTYVTAESDGKMTHREDHPSAWQILRFEVIE